ncbi:MAG: T9SS type A sorting domain-containing protein [Ignavibacteria bacterium]|nr:T9SS type A sorting domain-containing protein [Ignavibacteria bacterium]
MPLSKPKNIKVSKFIVDPVTGKFEPKVTWDANIEPDFTINGIYNIYRGIQYECDIQTEPSYIQIGTVNAGKEEFIDHNIYLYPRSDGSGICEYQFRSLSYKVEAVDNSNKPSLKSDRSIINGYTAPCDPLDGKVVSNNYPKEFKIYNYPNPFNPITDIKFDLPQNAFVTLKIYNVLGEEVSFLINKEYKDAGRYSVKFDGSNLASGIYYYYIEAGLNKDVKKMVLIK